MKSYSTLLLLACWLVILFILGTVTFTLEGETISDANSDNQENRSELAEANVRH